MKQKTKIYAIWWLQKVQQQQSLVFRSQVCAFLLPFDTGANAQDTRLPKLQHDRFANISKAKKSKPKNFSQQNEEFEWFFVSNKNRGRKTILVLHSLKHWHR